MPRTPADLRAMRLRLGLQEDQLATLLGRRPGEEMRRIEDGRQNATWREHAAVLERLDAAFLAALEALQADPPPVLLGYANDAAFAAREPALAERLLFNTVHRMLLAVAQDQLAGDGRAVPIVEFVPKLYGAWCDRTGHGDSRDSLMAWAMERAASIQQKEGFPPP